MRIFGHRPNQPAIPFGDRADIDHSIAGNPTHHHGRAENSVPDRRFSGRIVRDSVMDDWGKITDSHIPRASGRSAES